MQPLVFYAKKYKEDELKNVHAKNMFIHLWRHHDKERSDAIKALGIPFPACSDYLEIYAGKYAAPEMGNLSSRDTDLAATIKSALIEHISFKLKMFLIHKNLIGVQTLFLADHLLFDPHWCNHQGGYYRYNFGDKKRDTILDCACDLNDVGIMNQIVDASRIDCTTDAIISMIRNYRIELLGEFMSMHYEKARENRFSLWQYAISDRSLTVRHLDLKFFRTIVTLLFPQEIDAQDEFKRSLLHEAILAHNAAAVRFLIEQGANINLPDHFGYLPLYNAYEDPEITQLLIDHGADVNECNAGGRTAIMSAICYAKCNQKTLKVINILLAAGADATLIDEQGKSVFHHYAERHSYCSIDEWEMIKVFILLGIKVDQEDNDGKTPLDYANQNRNDDLINLFTFHRSHPIQGFAKEKISSETSSFDETPESIRAIRQVTEEGTNPISYKQIIAMSGFVLLTAAVIHYLLKCPAFS
jgi:hypothetical protein